MKTGRYISIVLILTAFLTMGMTGSYLASDWISTPAASAETVSLTTPELINEAYRHGELNDEQRLMLLAYAVFDPSSLPERFRSPQIWDGTFVVSELHAALQAAKLGKPTPYSPQFAQALEQILSPASATVCGEEDMPNSYDSAHFHINYGTIYGGRTLNDYANALEAAYTTEVTSYGWAAPPYYFTNPWNRIPVQIAFLGEGLIGYTAWGEEYGSYAGLVGNNPNTGAIETAAYASCIVLNDNFSYFTLGLNQLKSSSAHEFNHAIQVGIGDPYPYEDSMWYESVAAYMEDEVVDSSNANYRHLWPNFSSCLGEYGDNDYSNWLFFRYAAEQYGGTNTPGGGEDVAQNLWTNIAASQQELTAFSNALISEGGNLPDFFHKYAIATRFMKACPGGSPYCYEEAAGYLSAAGAIASHGSIPSSPGFYAGAIKDHYGLSWVDLPVTGSFTATLSNLNSGSGLRGSLVAETASGLTVTPFPSIIGNGGSTSLINFSPPPGTTRMVAVVTNQTQVYSNPSACSEGQYRLFLNMSAADLQSVFLPLAIKPLPPMKGQVTYRGSPVNGYPLQLRYRNASNVWSTYSSTNTDSNGNYSFTDQPVLTSSHEAKYVRWDNPFDNDNLLGYWGCNYLYYDSSSSEYQCNFDIENIDINGPSYNSNKNLPVVFSWDRRYQTSDSYELNLYDSDYVPFWWSPELGYVSSYQLSSLPNGFVYGHYYRWYVGVYGPDGYGNSYYYYQLAFSGSGSSPSLEAIPMSELYLSETWNEPRPYLLP